MCVCVVVVVIVFCLFSIVLVVDILLMILDISGKLFVVLDVGCDYDKCVVMVLMCDGIKLYMVIVVFKGVYNVLILLIWIFYDVVGCVSCSDLLCMCDLLLQGDEVFVDGGYICVFQDIRGKYGFEGDYVMIWLLCGLLNNIKVDYFIDVWDIIDWLVKNVLESNGKVGMFGLLYEGFIVVMVLIDLYLVLKVVVLQSLMVDGWMGDDWFNYGVFCQVNFNYFVMQIEKCGKGMLLFSLGYDDYSIFLCIGLVGDYVCFIGVDQLIWWKKLVEYLVYDGFWQGQVLDVVMVKILLKVLIMWLQGLWDQEDMWGVNYVYQVMEGCDSGNNCNYLVMGLW